MMELKMGALSLPKGVEFNYEELKAELVNRVGKYEAAVYDDDQIAQAKKDRASLNRLKKTMNDERIRLEREYMEPFQDFKNKITELCKMVERPVAIIDSQIKAYEEKQKAEKLETVQAIFDGFGEAAPEWLTLDQIMDAKWLNASTSESTIKKEIGEKLDKIGGDLLAIEKMANAFEIREIYRQTLDMSQAIREGERIAQMMAEKKALEEEKAAVKPEEPEEEAEEVTVHLIFEADLTLSQAKKLHAFCVENHINLARIDG